MVLERLKRALIWIAKRALDYFVHFLAIAAIAGLVALFKSYRDSGESFEYYIKRPIEYVTPLLIALLSFGCFILFMRLRGARRQLTSTTKTLASFGARAFSPHRTEGDKQSE
jgi:hypothetical protein